MGPSVYRCMISVSVKHVALWHTSAVSVYQHSSIGVKHASLMAYLSQCEVYGCLSVYRY